MTPDPSFTGAPAGQIRAENRKAPSVTGGAQKIPVRCVQRTRKLPGSPAQGGLNSPGTHSDRVIDAAHDDPPQPRG
jgi:hypothetical protein